MKYKTKVMLPEDDEAAAFCRWIDAALAAAGIDPAREDEQPDTEADEEEVG